VREVVVVLAEALAMVGREDKQRRVPETERPERADECADVIVGVPNSAS
jgi:hypothetical protein